MSFSLRASIALATLATVYAQASHADFLSDSKASVSSRTLYLENDVRALDTDQRQTATGLKFDYLSGYTQGAVGFGVDVQALVGVNLGGGIDHQSASTSNTLSPVTTDGSPVDNWSSLRGVAKAKISKTEAKVGNSFTPALPILVANDGRLLPAAYSGAQLNSAEIDNFNITAGRFDREIGRASSNWAGLAMNGGSKGSNGFWFGGADWKVTKDLTLQYYYANLEDYYRQNFLGLVHVLQVTPGQSFKTDLRYFNSKSDGRNGQAGYSFNNNGGYADTPGEVDNTTWAATFTYTLGGNSFLLGHQQVGDKGGFAAVNNGGVRDGRGRPEGEGGASYYLVTDVMINSFIRAGENTTYGQYAYDFSSLGVPGLKASLTYLHANGIKDAAGSSRTFKEWERDYRIDYVVQSGVAKGLGFSLRRANYRSGVPDSQGGYDTDQTRFYVNYTYSFF